MASRPRTERLLDTKEPGPASSRTRFRLRAAEDSCFADQVYPIQARQARRRDRS